jgi:S-adenosylmethionine hydrolase
MRPIHFLSDFGLRDAYVGIVESVMMQIAPDARVVHLAHEIEAQDVRAGAYQLWSAVPYLPDRAIVLAVVDPGVGSARRAICVEASRCTYVAPDNGLLEAALAIDPPRYAFAIESPQHRLANVSRTFHGRDVFGPAAAHVSRGLSPSELGPEVPLADLAKLGVLPQLASTGAIWTFDRFGNAITTLYAPIDPPAGVRVGDRELPMCTHYREVAIGEALAIAGSSGLIEISVRDGSARDRLALRAGDPIALL